MSEVRWVLGLGFGVVGGLLHKKRRNRLVVRPEWPSGEERFGVQDLQVFHGLDVHIEHCSVLVVQRLIGPSSSISLYRSGVRFRLPRTGCQIKRALISAALCQV